MRTPFSLGAAAAIIVLLVGIPLRLGSQGNPGASPVFSANAPPSGKLTIPAHAESIGTFRTLIHASQLIVDGTVISSLPTISPNPDSPRGVQTDSIIRVNEALHGKAPPAGQILLLEQGGQLGNWQVSTEGDPLVHAGERYILFLGPQVTVPIPFGEGILPDATVMSRYETVAFGNGKALVTLNGLVQFMPGAIPSLHSAFDNSDVTSFVQRVMDCLAELYPPPTPYPVGVVPLIPPNPNSIFVGPGIPLEQTKCGP